MTTIKIRIQDDFTGQDVKIKQTINGPQMDHYIEAFVAALLVIGFDQEMINQRMKIE